MARKPDGGSNGVGHVRRKECSPATRARCRVMGTSCESRRPHAESCPRRDTRCAPGRRRRRRSAWASTSPPALRKTPSSSTPCSSRRAESCSATDRRASTSAQSAASPWCKIGFSSGPWSVDCTSSVTSLPPRTMNDFVVHGQRLPLCRRCPRSCPCRRASRYKGPARRP